MNGELFKQSEIITVNDERLTISFERGTWNEKRKFLGNYMVIRVQQKGEKKQSPDLG